MPTPPPHITDCSCAFDLKSTVKNVERILLFNQTNVIIRVVDVLRLGKVEAKESKYVPMTSPDNASLQKKPHAEIVTPKPPETIKLADQLVKPTDNSVRVSSIPNVSSNQTTVSGNTDRVPSAPSPPKTMYELKMQLIDR